MYDVITIGTASRDVFLQSEAFKIFKDPEHLKKIGFPEGEAQCFALGGKLDIGKPVLTTGGGATNAAVTFARQGFKIAAIIKVGQDEDADAIISELKLEGVVVHAARDRHTGTAYSSILLAPNGERTILAYRGASGDLTRHDIPLAKLKSRWAYIVPGNIEFAVIEGVIDHLWKNGVRIAINPSKALIQKKISGLKSILGKVSAVLVNREEAAYLTGVHFEHEKRIFKAFDNAVPGIAVMTDGGGGVHVSDGSYMWSAGIFKEREMIDRTGAGDAFGSGFVAGLMRHREECKKGLCSHLAVEYAIRLGSANATSMVESIGAKSGILTKHEFEKEERWRKFPIKIIRI